MNQTECAKIMAILHTNPSQHETTPATIEVWAWVLNDIPYEAAQVAAYDWLKYHKWRPMPAEFRTVVVNRLTDLPTPDDAWEMVEQRIKDFYPGITNAPWGAPEEIQRVVSAMGGIRALQASTKPILDAQEFARKYERYRERALREMNIPEAWERYKAINPGALLEIRSRVDPGGSSTGRSLAVQEARR